MGMQGWRVGRWVLLATALGQPAGQLALGFEGNPTADLPIVPPGYAFAVWGLIVLGCLAAAVWGLPASRAAAASYARVQWSLSVVQACFVAWLAVAGSPVVGLTLPVFLVMLVLLVRALRLVLRAPAGRTTRWLLGGTLGVYAGWSSAAIWLNGATLLPLVGLDPGGVAGVLWQSAFLAAAVVLVVVLVRTFQAWPAYVATVVWAFTGVIVSTALAGEPALLTVAAAGLAAIAVVAARERRRNRGGHQPRPGPGSAPMPAPA